MTSEEYARKFKSRLEIIRELASCAEDEIVDFEAFGGSCSDMRERLNCLAMDLEEESGKIMSLCDEQIESEDH